VGLYVMLIVCTEFWWQNLWQNCCMEGKGWCESMVLMWILENILWGCGQVSTGLG